MDSLVILSAALLDLIFGDPRWFPHPVRGIGWLIWRGEAFLRRFAGTSTAEKNAGIVLALFIVFSVYLLFHYLIVFASSVSPYLGFSVAILTASATLAARGLGDAAKAVLMHLDAGDIVSARKELSMIVGRDTENLDEQEIVRAVVETVAENTSDGVIAPLFYLAVGGPALAMTYKAVNTMDSMMGHKNQKYINFGLAAARLDDIANYIPARITAVFIVFSTAIISRSLFTIRSSLQTMLRDHANHPSPNSGYPEAAVAGALGVRLGGQSAYAGAISQKPYIGDALFELEKKYIAKAVLLMYCSSLIAVLLAAALKIAARGSIFS